MEDKNQKSKSAEREEEVLKFWKENSIFEKSLEKESPKGEFVFYEGPPTANGKPGIHHLEARAFKDVIPRYKTMCGYHVRRKGGWDTHGLPVELQVEKKLGLTSKKAIEEYGIAKFNQECKESVWEYVDLWEKFTERIGFWLDQKDPYVTYHNNYIESVWNVIKTANDKKLLYKDYKVVPWCPRCGTGLSSHELAQGYEDVKDLSVTAKFKLTEASHFQISSRLTPKGPYTDKKSENVPPIYILAWTTTPWTLPGNVALAVGEKMDYVKILQNGEYLILAKARLSIVEGEYKIESEFKGKDLIGLEYEPLYPFLKDNVSDNEKEKLDKAYKVYQANFVTTEDGTGVVHTAVMYGQDDFELGTEIGLPKHHLVGLDGKFLTGTGQFEGRFVRDEDVAVDIIKDLAHRGLLFKKEKYEHSYPHCWRCHTALIYYARDSWYIKMTSLRDEMVKGNEEINWEPSYIKEGRFGDWLREIKDWAISRERYWGSPLPVWICNDCKKVEVVGSIEDIKSKTKKSGNKYLVMRHGQAEVNISEFIITRETNHQAKLTKKGEDQVLESSKNFKEKVDVVIASPFERSKQTAIVFCQQIGFSQDKVIYDKSIGEWEVSSFFEGKSKDIFNKYYGEIHLKDPFEALPNGESFAQVVKRVGDFIYDLENKYSGKTILLIGHAGATRVLDFVARGFTFETLKKEKNTDVYLRNAEVKELNFIPLPHNENYELDLHKPFIDEIELVCDCGGKLERTKEVMDVWLDSGTMPFSQDHYPFENKEFIDNGGGYPADFISEAIDQTRGWFYTLHAVGAIMGKGKAYKNVICLGHLLDSKGKKMSKSVGNVVDPWFMMDKYGVDTLRLWMYAVNQPGESKNFDEKTVSELHNKIFNLLYNVLAFYELYRDKSLESQGKVLPLESPRQDLKETFSTSILDKWIIARLDQLIGNTTKSLDGYKLLEPVRAIREFLDDLSTWYVRRSRERLKDGDVEAKQTLYYVLKILIKLMAPFAPFASEDIWQKLKNSNDVESVHLAEWPVVIDSNNSQILSDMQKVREMVTLGLEARQKAGIKVRQPLSQLLITNYQLPIEYLEIIKEELNIKDVKLIDGSEQKVELDLKISEELKKEGQYRELVRAIQDMRKKIGLNPIDFVILSIYTKIEGEDLVNKFKDDLLKTVGAKEIKFEDNSGEEIKVDELLFKIKVVK